jgi:FtsP/CotA-like multicopper oxidase with cupredoxin domain
LFASTRQPLSNDSFAAQIHTYFGVSRFLPYIEDWSDTMVRASAFCLLCFLHVSGIQANSAGSCTDLHRCGSFLALWPSYTMCRNGNQICTSFASVNELLGYKCGTCVPGVYTSPFPVFQWEDACAGSDYDKVGTVKFCQLGLDKFGYRLSDSDTCGALAPLIRMQPGVKYQLRLQNDATEATNVHAHGFHISGSGNGDDITREVSPGNCLFYNWTIPADHMDGTFWYHAHKHPRTRAHVDGGARGLLLVDPPANAPVRPYYIESRELLLLLSTSTFGMTANGKKQERLFMEAGKWYYLRVLVADPEAPVRDLIFGKSCEVHLGATDGVWRTVVPNPVASSRFTASGSNRLDFAIKCSSSASLWWGSTLIAPMVIFDVASPQGSEEGTLEPWVPARPLYLTDLRSEAIAANTFEVSMQRSTINNEYYDPAIPLASLPFGPFQQWNLINTGEHPFHLHVYHVQIVTPGGCGHIFEEGEWYDSISAANNIDCLVRFRPLDFGGRAVLHCHTLEHEDMGSMGWVDFYGGPAPFTDLVGETSCATGCFA